MFEVREVVVTSIGVLANLKYQVISEGFLCGKSDDPAPCEFIL